MNSDTKIIKISKFKMESFSSRESGGEKLTSPPLGANVELNIKTIVPKQRVKLVITKSSSWNFTEIDLQPEKQLEYIFDSHHDASGVCNELPSSVSSIVKKKILQKICSYRTQDVIKKKYNSEKFITYNETIHKLRECNLKCFYCDKVVYILYENVREPIQWSLERIDNQYGHNNDNTEIACLNCNLNRKTMYHERYRMTKKLVIIRTG